MRHVQFERVNVGAITTWAVATLLLASLVGCAGDDDDDSSTSEGGADAGEPGAGDTIMITVRLVGSQLPGFEICNTDADELGCATTDDAGEAALEVPANADVALTIDKEGYIPLLVMQRTGSEDATHDLGFALPADAQLGSHPEALGISLDPQRGSVVGYVFGGTSRARARAAGAASATAASRPSTTAAPRLAASTSSSAR